MLPRPVQEAAHDVSPCLRQPLLFPLARGVGVTTSSSERLELANLRSAEVEAKLSRE
jgi:hypothetical protein